MKTFLAALLIILGTRSLAQDTLKITTKSNVSRSISAYTTLWSQKVTEPDGTVRRGNNTIRDSVYVVEDEGLESLVKEVKWLGTNNSWFIRTDKLNPQNFAPRSVDVRWNPSYVQHTDFEESLVSGATLSDPLKVTKLSLVPYRNTGFAWASDGGPLIGLKIPDVPYFILETVSGYPDQPVQSEKFFEIVGREKIVVNKLGEQIALHLVNRSSNLVSHYWLVDKKPYLVKVLFEQNTGQKTEWVIESLSN